MKYVTPQQSSHDPMFNSAVTARYQTTIPTAVRQFLGLQKSDRVGYSFMDDGSVLMCKIENEPEEHTDPTLQKFLCFLEKDTVQDKVKPLSTDLYEKINALVGDASVDLDSTLDYKD